MSRIDFYMFRLVYWFCYATVVKGFSSLLSRMWTTDFKALPKLFTTIFAVIAEKSCSNRRLVPDMFVEANLITQHCECKERLILLWSTWSDE